ncbi:hypothetical protein [Natrialba asiatica]|uniref:Uncharacterized protein n=1 Tax=Natrialba asiatica (strain ATCC 700177 / DSM 12278 / JCM 9576 / FERM P-10747 / NBRC 102637 / 172P1) TaxID=29540 RepID=M0AF08_NATA1|nr:hypothetical protein [Natrialba asiatica]ELY97109.1 hypothetical protein C481_21001 [Natrialba asiatica DSM 12278]
MSDRPDAPACLVELTGEQREEFEYTGKIHDLSEMESTPIDEADVGGVDVGSDPFDALSHRDCNQDTDEAAVDT